MCSENRVGSDDGQVGFNWTGGVSEVVSGIGPGGPTKCLLSPCKSSGMVTHTERYACIHVYVHAEGGVEAEVRLERHSHHVEEHHR